MTRVFGCLSSPPAELTRPNRSDEMNRAPAPGIGRGDPDQTTGPIIGAIFLVAITLRVFRAQLPDDTFYADDVFQMLEPAHRLAFGYGYVAWEFVAGVRNWLLPGLLGLLLRGLAALGLDQPEAYGPIVTGLSILLSLTPIEAAQRAARLIGGTRAGILAAAGASIYPPLIYASQKITPEIFAGYALSGALLFALKTERRSAVVAGLLCGVVAGLRIHYAPALLAIIWVIFARRDRNPEVIIWVVGAGAASFSLFGAADWVTWGIPFVSYVRAIEVNVLYGVAAQFGIMPIYFYVALFPFGVALAVLAAGDWQRTKWFVIPIVVILLVHSMIGHKEPRFVFAIHALTVTAIAIPLSDWIERGAPRRPLAIAICICTIFMCVVSFVRAPQSIARLTADYRAAISELRADPNLRALAVYGISIYEFPGAYRLHENIPVLQEGDTRSLDNIPAGVTHIIVAPGTAVTKDFETVRTFDLLELRRRSRIDKAAPLPPVNWSMPMIFSRF